MTVSARYRPVAAGLLACLCTSLTASFAFAAPPIVQPGAPGDPSRTLTPEQSVALARDRYVPADVAFMQHMIVHHGQAVEMGDLVEGRSAHRGIGLMAERIAMSQAAEMNLMRAWLESRNESTEMAHGGADHGSMHHGTMHHGEMGHGDMGHGDGHHDMIHGEAPDRPDPDAAPSDVPLMPGMLSPAQMAELAASEGETFNRLYLTGMIHHHQGAIDMVERLLDQPGAGEEPELAEFLASVLADQSAEIARMRAMLDTL